MHRSNLFSIPYRGDWTAREAAHLLGRAQFGARREEVERAAQEGLANTVRGLISPPEEGEEFQQSSQLLEMTALDAQSIAQLKAWWLYRMLYSPAGLQERMTLFWHNHFATSFAKVQSLQHMLSQNRTFRQHALGDFRQLLHTMSRDVAMLIWLDGNANRKRHPNENFARELMELFSLGVGNYTEDDIKEAARAFTGWHVRQSKFWFNRSQHDGGEKTVFGKRGRMTGDQVVDLCLGHQSCSRFLASKLLRAFVRHNPSDQAVADLAARIRGHEFQLAPVLHDLLSSDYFFAAESRNSLIKSPLSFVLGTQRALSQTVNLGETSQLLASLGQDIFEPPTVKGWEGGRLWVSSASLLQRHNFAAELISEKYGSLVDLDLELVEVELEAPAMIVEYLVERLLSRPLPEDSLTALRQHFEKASGNRSERVQELLYAILTLPEYQLG